jgi:hypothetical protein
MLAGPFRFLRYHMPDLRVRKPRPLHPFPFIAGCRPLRGPLIPAKINSLTRAQNRILTQLRQGARILFDIDQKRALLYSLRRGIEHLAELTVRAIAGLLRAGKLAICAREGRLVHYALTE